MGNFLKHQQQADPQTLTYDKTVTKTILLYGEPKSGLDTLLYKLLSHGMNFESHLDEKMDNISSQTGIYYDNNTKFIYKFDVSHEKSALQNKWDIVLVVFDMSDAQAIENLYTILSHIEGFHNIVLVANKVDISICSKNASMLNDLPLIYDYFEVSSKTGNGITNLLGHIQLN